MNRRNMYILNGIIVSFLVLLILGCGDRSGNKTATSGGQQSAKYKDSSDGAMQDGMIEIVDFAGRTVTVPTGDVKVILGASFMISAIAPLFGKNGNPFTSIVGLIGNIEKNAPDTYEMYLEKFPEMSTITNLGSLYRDLSIEKIISLNPKPDIILMSLYQLTKAQEIGMIEKLDKVGIKTVFLDIEAFSKQLIQNMPLQNVIPSILLLGQIFDKTDEASKFANFYFAQMQKVSSIVETIDEEEKPLVFMEKAPNSGFWEKGGEYRVFGYVSFGRYVELAGGKNYGTAVFGSKSGIISAEQLFVIDPDVIIGTGANWSKTKPTTGAVLLGYKAQKKDSQERLNNIATRIGWETLKAVKNKRVHSIYHNFEDFPYHFIPVLQMAKWLYPKKFADLDPEKIFIEFHDKFLPISYSGMFWASLE